MKNYEDCVNEAARLSFDAGIDPRNILTSKYANLLFKLSKAEDLQAKYGAVVAELEHCQNQLDQVCEEGCTPADAKKLREINHALADDIELRDKEIAALKAEVEKMIDHQLKMADQYNEAIQSRVKAQAMAADMKKEIQISALEYITLMGEMQTHLESIPKLKADAIREAGWMIDPRNESEDRVISLYEDYADKLERGDV